MNGKARLGNDQDFLARFATLRANNKFVRAKVKASRAKDKASRTNNMASFAKVTAAVHHGTK